MSLPSDDPNSLAPMLEKITDDGEREVYYYCDELGRPREVLSNLAYDEGQPVGYLYTLYTLDTVAQYCTRGWMAQVKSSYMWEEDEEWESRLVNQNDYTYSNAGQRLTNAVSDNNGPVRTEEYAYDRLYRLTGVDYGDNHTRAYAFDAMGNRTSYTVDGGTPEGSTFNAANMLLTRGGQSYTNDAAGNTTVDGVTGRQMTWDSQNRMTQCVVNSTTSTFTYGADGLRRRMVVGTNTTDYVLDGQSVVREFVTAQGQQGSYTATYLLGPRGPECKRDGQGTYEWYVYDGLGSVVATVNDSGTVVSSRVYDVYGAVRSGGGGSRHKFVGSLGHPSDDETGLVYMRARYMDPATGRFVSEDPAQDGGNWFLYGGGAPSCLVDPTGCANIVSVTAGMTLTAFMQHLGQMMFRVNILYVNSMNRVVDISKGAHSRTYQLLYDDALELGLNPEAVMAEWQQVNAVLRSTGPGSASLKAIVRVQGGNVIEFLLSAEGEVAKHAWPYIK